MRNNVRIDNCTKDFLAKGTKDFLAKASKVFGENEKAIAERAISREIARMVVEHKKKTTGEDYLPTDAMCAAVYAMEDGEGASHGVDV